MSMWAVCEASVVCVCSALLHCFRCSFRLDSFQWLCWSPNFLSAILRQWQSKWPILSIVGMLTCRKIIAFVQPYQTSSVRGSWEWKIYLTHLSHRIAMATIASQLIEQRWNLQVVVGSRSACYDQVDSFYLTLLSSRQSLSRSVRM